MKNGFVKVGAYSPEVKVADTIFNKGEIIKAMHVAHEQGVKLLALPELAITGYSCGDLFYHDTLLNAAVDALDDIVKSSKGLDMLVLVGMPLKHHGNIYNVAVALFEGSILGVVPKSFLPNYNEFYEKRHFVPAEKDVVDIKLCGQIVPFGANIIFADSEMPAFKVACEICEDIWVMCPPTLSHAKAGATVLVNLSASNEVIGKARYREAMVAQQSGKTLSAYIYVSSGVSESTSETVFGGHKIIAEDGYVLSSSKLFTEDFICTEIDLFGLLNGRSKMADYIKDDPSYRVVEFCVNKDKCNLTRKYPKTPFIPTAEEFEERCELTLNLQAHALAKRIKHTGIKSLVLGISGGLDSTLALLATVKAVDLVRMDRKSIIGVTMPCFGTTSRTLNNALTLMGELGVTVKNIDIKEAVLQHFKDIEHDPNVLDVTYENAQARERTQVLMDLANKYNGLVIGTGDLSESALGWSTFNGDHMSMYGINCGVPKTMVSSIIRYVAVNSEGNLKNVLNDILATEISPELLPPDSKGNIQQKTEDKVGPYVLHDFFLFYMIRKAMAPSKVYRLAKYAFDGDYSDEVIKKWLIVFIKRFFSQQFKRNCVPDGVKIGTVCLSPRSDWKMVSDAEATVWLKELEDNAE